MCLQLGCLAPGPGSSLHVGSWRSEQRHATCPAERGGRRSSTRKSVWRAASVRAGRKAERGAQGEKGCPGASGPPWSRESVRDTASHAARARKGPEPLDPRHFSGQVTAHLRVTDQFSGFLSEMEQKSSRKCCNKYCFLKVLFCVCVLGLAKSVLTRAPLLPPERERSPGWWDQHRCGARRQQPQAPRAGRGEGGLGWPRDALWDMRRG